MATTSGAHFHDNVINSQANIDINTPVGDHIANARSVLYELTANTHPSNTPMVPVNTPFNTPFANVPQNLSFTDSPLEHIQPLPIASMIADIYDKLNKLGPVPEMLQKLDLLPSISEKINTLDQRFTAVESEIGQIKNDLGFFHNRISSNENQIDEVDRRVAKLEFEKEQIMNENYELKERVIDMQARSMRDNLIFSGVDESPQEQELGADNIHTENQLKLFIKEVMNIEQDIKFQVVHRLRPRKDNKPRSIIAKFERRKDRDFILENAPKTLQTTNYSVYEQLPKELMERRNELWPIYKREKRLGNKCKFRGDVLIVNGIPVYPSSKKQPRRNPSQQQYPQVTFGESTQPLQRPTDNGDQQYNVAQRPPVQQHT